MERKAIISGSIKTSGDFSETREVGFSIALTTQGNEPVSRSELLNELLSTTLRTLAKEEGQI
ncbi:MAG: hypothetical protein ACI4FZ_11855 [Lachnospiraceae bacterium]